MKAVDANRIIKGLAGSEFVILKGCSDSDHVVQLKHVPCGHVFSRSVASISSSGILCSRCNNMKAEQMLDVLDEEQSLSIYRRCKDLIGPGYKIVGDTGDLSNTVMVKCLRNERSTLVVIDDLINHRNLPDYLQHCWVESPTVQLQTLQFFVKDSSEILDDFSTLEDIVRVRDCYTERVSCMKVLDVMQLARKQGKR